MRFLLSFQFLINSYNFILFYFFDFEKNLLGHPAVKRGHKTVDFEVKECFTTRETLFGTVNEKNLRRPWLNVPPST
jgi:hypothetical protein